MLAVADPLPTSALSDDWVVTLPLERPAHALPDSVPWEQWGNHRVFFYGLLFDREALISKYGGSLSDSDAKLVLRAYERAGDTALPQLRGSFVVIIIDDARGTALVVRDPMGLHPLFFVETSSSVLFATTPRALLDQPGVSRAFNRVALADHLCHRWPDPHETFFSAVRRVPPGWRATISGGRLHLDRYWDPCPEDRPIEWLTATDAARFDEVFDRAIDRCLVNGPAGILLSGGLDSISVAAVAADRARHIGRSPPLALSLGFPDPECDERLRQAAVGRDLELRQHLIDFNDALASHPLFEQSLALARELDAPVLNSWLPAYLPLVRRAKLDGVQTILTGEGGDEWLTVAPHLAADLIRRGALGELVRFFGVLQRSYRLNPFALARNVFFRYGLRPLGGLLFHRLLPTVHQSRRLRLRIAGDPIWVAPDPEIRAEQRRRAEATLAPANPPQGFYFRELRTGLDHTLTSWSAEERYFVGKRLGVQFLHPFLDPDVVELLYRTPPHILNDGGRTKGLVRRTISQRFPALGLERQRKVAATSFYRTLQLREMPALLEAAGRFPTLSALNLVDGPAARAFVDRELDRPGSRFSSIWHIVNLEMWVRSHGQSPE